MIYGSMRYAGGVMHFWIMESLGTLARGYHFMNLAGYSLSSNCSSRKLGLWVDEQNKAREVWVEYDIRNYEMRI